MANILTSLIGSVSQAISKVIKDLPVVSKQPASLFNPSAILSQFIIPRAVPVIKTEGTAQTFGQQYLIQSYNSDGLAVTRYVSLSEIRTGPTNVFNPENASAILTPSALKKQAQLLQGAGLTADQVQTSLQDSLKVDYFMCLYSQESAVVEFNSLQTPSFDAQFNYNFYIPKETEISSQEDLLNDPFLKNVEVPRYVQLTWDTVDTIQPSLDFGPRTKEEQQLIAQYIQAFRGTATATNTPTANSFKSNLRQVNSLNRDGVNLELVDTHDLEKAFNSISNGKIFKDSVLTVINTNSIDLNSIDFNDLILDDL